LDIRMIRTLGTPMAEEENTEYRNATATMTQP